MLASSKRWLLLALMISALAYAQQEQLPEGSGGSESTQGVYVRDSAIALEKFALGQRMERLKEWNKAADVFQEILEKYPDRVVQSKTDTENNVFQYKSVIVAVQERIAKWPTDGLNVYKARYEPAAQGILEQAKRDDYGALHKVFSLYFATESGKVAGMRLIDLYLENGEFSAAAWLGDRLLQWQPDLIVERPGVLYRAALAYHLSGEAAKAKEKLDELKGKFAQATGKVRGVDAVLAESLEKELSAAPPARAAGGGADSWPVFMGDASRSRVSTGMGRPGARAFVSIEMAKVPSRRGASAAVRPENLGGGLLMENGERSANTGLADATGLMGTMPAVDRNELFFQDGQRVYAVSLESGLALPGWLTTYPGEKNGRYLASAALPRGGQTTVTLTDEEVLAVMGQPVNAALAAQLGQMGFVQPRAGGGVAEAMVPPDRETRLVCLDRVSGKEKWVATARTSLPKEGTLRSLSLSGSPLVVGDNVYVIGRGGKGVQFEDCYVICFDLHNGKYKWSCYIASANTGNLAMMGGDTPSYSSDTVSHLAYASGRLFVLTNLGAVAAVDAYGGSIAWLNIYPRDVDADPGNVRARVWRGGAPTQNRPWAGNPVMVQDGKVFVLPTDGKHVLVYNAGSGAEIKRLNLIDFVNPDTLVGVNGNRMVLAGDYSVYCVDWTKYDAMNFNPKNSDAIVWPQKMPAKTPIRGRAFMTADSVFVPTRERLYRIDMATGKIADTYPTSGRVGWDEDEGPGNVLVTGDKVVIAGARRVNVYTDMAVATAKLNKEIANAPSDPDPRLRYADVLFISGDATAALGKLDEAIGLLGGNGGAMRPGPARDRVFNTAMTFAQKLSDPKTGTPDSVEIINKLFDRAATAASSAQQQVNYRIGRAKFLHTRHEYTAEIKLQQEILGDEQLRMVSVTDEENQGPLPAAMLAESQIAIAMKADPLAYEPYEKAAREAMDFAKAKRDAGEFQAIAQRYPNSAQALQAMLLAAESFEAAGNYRQSTQILRQIYTKYPESKDKAQVLEALARNYLAIPNHLDVAIARLMQAAKTPGEPPKLSGALKLPGGNVIEKVTFAEAASAVRQYQLAQVAKELPDFHLVSPAPRQKPGPAFAAESAPIEGVHVLVPQQRGFSRNDRVVTWSPGTGLAVYPVGETTPAANNAIKDAPRELAWVDGNLLVWTDSEIFLLKGEKLSTIWNSPVKKLPTAEVIAVAGGAEEMAQDAQLADDADAQVIINGRLQLRNRGIVVRNGRVVRFPLLQQAAVPQQPLPPNPPAVAGAPEAIVHARPAGDRVIVATSTGRVFAIDANEGHLVWQCRLTDSKPIERLLANEDYAVVKLSDESLVQIAAFDSYSGQLIKRWNFNNQPDQSPINMALASDGTLVYTLMDRICGKNLNEPNAPSSWEVPGQAPGMALYTNASLPDQLVIDGNRILAISDNPPRVRVHDLETGRVVRTKGPNGRMEVAFQHSGIRSLEFT